MHGDEASMGVYLMPIIRASIITKMVACVRLRSKLQYHMISLVLWNNIILLMITIVSYKCYYVQYSHDIVKVNTKYGIRSIDRYPPVINDEMHS